MKICTKYKGLHNPLGCISTYQTIFCETLTSFPVSPFRTCMFAIQRRVKSKTLILVSRLRITLSKSFHEGGVPTGQSHCKAGRRRFSDYYMLLCRPSAKISLLPFFSSADQSFWCTLHPYGIAEEYPLLRPLGHVPSVGFECDVSDASSVDEVTSEEACLLFPNELPPFPPPPD